MDDFKEEKKMGVRPNYFENIRYFKFTSFGYFKNVKKLFQHTYTYKLLNIRTRVVKIKLFLTCSHI